jgi:hypothetical protein
MGLESCCAKSLNRVQVFKFFDILKELVTEYGILSENTYNMVHG